MQHYAGVGAGLGAATIGERIQKLIDVGSLSQVGVADTLPVGLPLLTIDQLEKEFGKPWYKQWWVWALAGTAVAGGTYLVLRRR
jgi:hypothetical protein